MEKPKYLVRFTNNKYLPNFKNLENCSIKLGTFQHYKKMENNVRKDEVEGQSGVYIKVKKPCSIYIGLFGQQNQNELNELGEFKQETLIDVSDHSSEFNTWMFCASAVNSLEEIEQLKQRFNCDSYYFIKDYKKFENSIQKSLAEDLIRRPLNTESEQRVIKGEIEKYFLSGERKYIRYKNIKKYMLQQCETLTEFYNSQSSKQVNSDLWFFKPENYEVEKECRFIFYAVVDKNHDKFFNIKDDFVILNCDLTDAISLEPAELK